MCGICEIENKLQPLNLFTDEEIDAIVEKVFIGIISLRSLDLETYLRVARKLTEGVYEGFGKTLFDVQFNSPDYDMLRALRENCFIFSGAKQYQQIREMNALLTSEERVNSFYEFKKKAKEIFVNYNENYLYSEYNVAISAARSANQWMTIEAEQEALPMVTYKTVGDGRVRPTHAALDNISRPVRDKFWDSYMPPNGWNCRCTVIQSDEAEKTSLRGFKKPHDVPDIFLYNPGKSRIVYSPKHPYFKVAPRDKEFAKLNFNLPLP